MFRKPPIKTYQKKRPAGAPPTLNPSSIVREDIAENKQLQPKEFVAFKDSDTTLEYDPFDTTFDRLMKDTKMPPAPPKQDDTLSYSSSSSEAANSSMNHRDSQPLPDPLPLINPKPYRRHKHKKQKVKEELITVRVTKLADLLGGRFYSRKSGVDENTEPNVEREKSVKRGRKKKASGQSSDETLTKKRRVPKKMTVSSYKRKIRNLNLSKSLRRCSVRLTRVNIPLDRSTGAFNPENAGSDSKRIFEETADPGEAQIRREFSKDKSISPRDIKVQDTFKNPVVSLTRLNLQAEPSRPSAANKSWLNSTPIDRKILKPKSLFHFSPIGIDKSMGVTGSNSSYDDQSSLPRKSKARTKNFTSKSTKTQNTSNFSKQLEKNSNKSRTALLSDSPDPEPSDLLFEDTETLNPDTDSYATPRKTENRAAVKEPMTELSKGSAGSSPGTSREDSQLEFRASAASMANECETMETTTSPLKGFAKSSTDSESLHLTFECSDTTDASLKELTRSHEKSNSDSRSSPASYEHCTDRESTEKNAERLQSNSKDSSKNQQNDSKDSTKNQKYDSKDSTKNQKNDSKDSSTNQKNDSKDSSKDLHRMQSAKEQQDVSKESDKDVLSQLNSDDEWETTSECPSNLSNENITQNGTTDGKLKSIVHMSSDDGNTSSEAIGEFADASENPNETKFDSQELPSFEVEENSKSGAISESNARAESSVVDISCDEKLLQNSHSSSIQPVVLLSRLSVPIRGSKKISKVANNLAENSDVSMMSIQELSSEKDDADIKKSVNKTQMASMLMEWESSENDESRESRGDMDSVKIKKVGRSTLGVDQSVITDDSHRDSSKVSSRWSRNAVKKASKGSSMKMGVDDISSGDESIDVLEASTKKLQIKETSIKIVDKEVDRLSINPIVLLNRLNDPIRVTDRRKKYRNWGLSAISESQERGNVTTIVQEREKLESENNKTKKKSSWNDSEVQLNGDGMKIASSQATTVSCDVSIGSNQGHESMKDDKVLFLKPGKSWSRSLSFFRLLHNRDDIEMLAVGKGKKWRQSVQNLLDMQQQRVIQSCVKKNEDDKESRSYYGVHSGTTAWNSGCSQPDATRVFSQTSDGSPGRFIRRVSIRVVPDSKNSEHYEDSPFLEAYGITSGENRKTFDERSTLKVSNKTLDYNSECDDVTFKSISRNLNSVTSRDVVLAQCGQTSSIPFHECYPASYLRHCRKIGEGVFGEVFLYENGTARDVIKIIPIEGELMVNGERQKKFDEILSEIVIAKELNNLRFGDTCNTSSFVQVKNIRCVIGSYPRMLIDLWKTYDNEKNSENDCPDNFDENQLYIVLELGHGGQDLEAFVFQNSAETYALFIQTALALAVAEESLEFEHRDLHWGNVLISRTDDTHIDYKLRNKDIRVPSKGVKVSVIDFTLSRMSYQGCSIFNDLSLDDDLFAAQGEYQFEIYRLMRQKVANNWQTFEPYTNVLWLHYTLDKMITAARYRRPNSKIHKHGIVKLTELKNKILNYSSAYDFVTNCDNVTRLQGSRSSICTVEFRD